MTLYWGGAPDALYWGGDVTAVYAGADLVWQSSPYPITGEWEGTTPNPATVVATFTVPEDGTYTLSWAITWSGSGTLYGQATYRINGGSLTSGNMATNAPGTSTVTGTETLQAGDVVDFYGGSIVAGPATGVWTIDRA